MFCSDYLALLCFLCASESQKIFDLCTLEFQYNPKFLYHLQNAVDSIMKMSEEKMWSNRGGYDEF